MTKLYCPKGHRKITDEEYFRTTENLGLGHTLERNWSAIHCYQCERPYLTIDCLTEPKKDQPHFRFSENNDIGIPISETSANSPTLKTESQIAIERVVEALDEALRQKSYWLNPSPDQVVYAFRDNLKEINK